MQTRPFRARVQGELAAFGKLLIGSVSNQVVHHAHCPVVVVPSER